MINLQLGKIYEGESIPFLNERVGVPNRIYKAIFNPGRNAATHVTPNTDDMEWQAV
jgi:hypothetical protein